MRVCVVGNGPSANGKGAYIDRFDYVVRCNRFLQAFPKQQAGKKVSAFAWAAYPRWNHIMPKGRPDMWVTCPIEWHKGKERVKNARKLSKARGCKLRVMKLPHYMEIRKQLKMLSDKTGDFPPTTGLLAVGMALEKMPDELCIVGFDAMRKGQPGWRYANRKMPFKAGPGHDFVAEKDMLDILEVDGTWCSGKYRAKEVRRVTV